MGMSAEIMESYRSFMEATGNGTLLRGGVRENSYVRTEKLSGETVQISDLMSVISKAPKKYAFKEARQDLTTSKYPYVDSGYPDAPKIEVVDSEGATKSGRLVALDRKLRRAMVYIDGGTNPTAQARIKFFSFDTKVKAFELAKNNDFKTLLRAARQVRESRETANIMRQRLSAQILLI